MICLKHQYLMKNKIIFFYLLNFINKGLHTFQGPLGFGKTFFVKYLIELQLQSKKMLFLATIRATTLQLSSHALTIHWVKAW